MATNFHLNLQSSQENPPINEKKDIKFLNYYSKNKDFEDNNNTIQKSEVRKIEEQYQTQMKDFIKQFLSEENSKQLNILPKKANVDLKRFLQPKIDKLNRRTEKAIIKLLKQKMKNNEEGEENKNKEKEEEKKSKLEQENEKLQKFVPVYQSGSQKYDQELIEDFENEGQSLVQNLETDYNIFQNFDEDLEDSD